MQKIGANGILDSIGNTPMFRLRRMVGTEHSEVWVKWEGANPTGSMKDRMALSMIQGAERRGQLGGGGKVVEYTGGSTGSSLALVCAARGYSSHFVCSDAFAAEKIATMRALGGTCEVIPSDDRKITPELIRKLIDRAKELSKEPGTFWTDQFNNPDNRAAYHKMAEEIIEQVGDFDAFVMSVGTGGCFSGNSEVFKERMKRVRCVAVEPATSRNLSGGALGAHHIEGIGSGFISKIMRMDLVDKVVSVSDEEASATARELARKEGVFGGTSSGANVFAALQLAKELGPGHKVVTPIVDSGLRYLAGDLFRT